MKTSADLLKWLKMEYSKQEQIGCHRYDNSNYSYNITYCGCLYNKPYFSTKTTAAGSNTNTNTNERTR